MNVPRGYESFFRDNETIVKKIVSIIQRRGRCFPEQRYLFRALDECPMSKVKVVIVGQDPYKRSDHATGMSFSIPPGVKPTQSLMNIYKCLEKSYSSFEIPNHGDLRAWCKQGVLLLNMCLAYFPDNPMDSTEMKFCVPFATRLIRELARVNPNLILVLWGNAAQQALSSIGGLPGTVSVLCGVHPSTMNGERFVNEVDHFREINEILDDAGEDPIVWDL